MQFCFQKHRSGTWDPIDMFSAPSGRSATNKNSQPQLILLCRCIFFFFFHTFKNWFLDGFLWFFFRWQRTQCFVIWSFNSGKPLKSYNTLGQIWRFRRTGTSPCNSGRLHLLNWWTSLYWKDSSEYRSCLLRKGNFILYTVLQMFRQM